MRMREQHIVFPYGKVQHIVVRKGGGRRTLCGIPVLPWEESHGTFRVIICICKNCLPRGRKT